MGKRYPGSYANKRKRFIELCKIAQGTLKCTICDVELVEGHHPPIKNSVTIDHIVPVSKGGSSVSQSNFQLCCLYCNQTKGDGLTENWINVRM